MIPQNKTGIQGLDEFLRNLNKELEKIKRGSTTGLTKAAWHVVKESVKIVPVATGYLKNSSYVRPPVVTKNRAVVELGYHAAYALYVHENPRSGKTYGYSPSGRKYPPGTWAMVGEYKFLEKPFRKERRKIIDIIVKNARRKR